MPKSRHPPGGTTHSRNPVALFVLGLGRSGTSALTRVLSLCGARLPPRLLGATSNNVRGCWEPRAAIQINETILRRHGSSGYDPTLRMQEQSPFDAGTHAGDIAKIQAFLTTLPRAPLTVIKQPQITVLSEMWFEAAHLAGFDVAAVIAMRHPQQVIRSFEQHARRQNYVQVSSALASAWWLKYTLLAERGTRDVPRVFVQYANLLDDWRREVKRISGISEALPIDLHARNEGAVEEFLTPELRHHRDLGAVPEPFGTDWMSTVYRALHAASQDEPWDEAALDRVFEAYRAGERGFRTAFEDYHRYRNLNRFIPTLAVRPVLEMLAMAHRRKGSWA